LYQHIDQQKAALKEEINEFIFGPKLAAVKEQLENMNSFMQTTKTQVF
jgi:hypothetical protein